MFPDSLLNAGIEMLTPSCSDMRYRAHMARLVLHIMCTVS